MSEKNIVKTKFENENLWVKINSVFNIVLSFISYCSISPCYIRNKDIGGRPHLHVFRYR